MVLQFIYYLISFAGILKKRSKFLTIIMLCLMWVIFGLCTYNGDYNNYNWIYQNIQTPIYWLEFEPLYNVLMYSCSIIGLSFFQFRMVFATIYILLLYYVIGKYTKNKAQVLGFFMIFPFLYFTSTIRSGIASVIVILAYYEITGGRNNKLKFWILMLIATLFHYTSIFFATYYFFRKMRGNKIFFVIFLVIMAFALFMSGFIYSVMKQLTDNHRVLKWYSPENMKQEKRWILYLIIIDFMVLSLIILSKFYNKINSKKYNITNLYVTDFFYFNIFLLSLFIPTFFVSNACSRFIWELLLFIIIIYAIDDEIRFKGNKINSLRYYRKDFLLLLFLLFFSFYENMPYRGTVNDGRLVFKNNILSGAVVP